LAGNNEASGDVKLYVAVSTLKVAKYCNVYTAIRNCYQYCSY